MKQGKIEMSTRDPFEEDWDAFGGLSPSLQGLALGAVGFVVAWLLACAIEVRADGGTSAPASSIGGRGWEWGRRALLHGCALGKRCFLQVRVACNTMFLFLRWESGRRGSNRMGRGKWTVEVEKPSFALGTHAAYVASGGRSCARAPNACCTNVSKLDLGVAPEIP